MKFNGNYKISKVSCEFTNSGFTSQVSLKDVDTDAGEKVPDSIFLGTNSEGELQIHLNDASTLQGFFPGKNVQITIEVTD